MKQCACEKERWPTCQRHACNVLSVRGTIRREGSSFPLRETGAVLPSFHGPLLASIWVWPGVGPTKPIPSDRTLQFSNGVWLSLLCAGPTEFYPTPCFSAPKKKKPSCPLCTLHEVSQIHLRVRLLVRKVMTENTIR